jgi:hypothetical protein
VDTISLKSEQYTPLKSRVLIFSSRQKSVGGPRKRWTGHYMRRRRKPGLAYPVTSAAAVDDDDESLVTMRLKL